MTCRVIIYSLPLFTQVYNVQDSPLSVLPNYHQTQQRSLWALMLTGLVIMTCLAFGLSQGKSFSKPVLSMANSAHAPSSVEPTSEMQSLFNNVFGPEASQPLTSPDKSSCSQSKSLPSFSAPLTGWVLPLTFLLVIALVSAPRSSRIPANHDRAARTVKNRIHLEHCIFRE